MRLVRTRQKRNRMDNLASGTNRLLPVEHGGEDLFDDLADHHLAVVQVAVQHLSAHTHANTGWSFK